MQNFAPLLPELIKAHLIKYIILGTEHRGVYYHLLLYVYMMIILALESAAVFTTEYLLTHHPLIVPNLLPYRTVAFALALASEYIGPLSAIAIAIASQNERRGPHS